VIEQNQMLKKNDKRGDKLVDFGFKTFGKPTQTVRIWPFYFFLNRFNFINRGKYDGNRNGDIISNSWKYIWYNHKSCFQRNKPLIIWEDVCDYFNHNLKFFATYKKNYKKPQKALGNEVALTILDFWWNRLRRSEES